MSTFVIFFSKGFQKNNKSRQITWNSCKSKSSKNKLNVEKYTFRQKGCESRKL